MALTQSVFLVLSVLVYSASAVTNLEVSRALKTFDSTLQQELCALNTKLNLLENLILDNIDRTCNPGSCSAKTCPDPIQVSTTTVAPIPIEQTTPLPVCINSTRYIKHDILRV